MQMRLHVFVLIAAILVLNTTFDPPTIQAEESDAVPRIGMVTMVDLGAKTCKPCKMMAPMLVELRQEYKGRAEIIFIDLRENPKKAKEFSVSIMPTQIFYDRTGKERQRHVGFLSKPFMAKIIDELLQEDPAQATTTP